MSWFRRTRLGDWLHRGDWPEGEKIAVIIALTLLAAVIGCLIWVITEAITTHIDILSNQPF